MEIIESILFILFYGGLTLFEISYIVKTSDFIIPITKKYDILIDNRETIYKNRIKMIIFFLILILIFIYTIFIIYGIYSIVGILIMIIHYTYQKKVYKSYNLINYMSEFSTDIYDWDKIYELNIDLNLKKKMFDIHNINFLEFKNQYINKMKIYQTLLQNKIDKTKKNETGDLQ